MMQVTRRKQFLARAAAAALLPVALPSMVFAQSATLIRVSNPNPMSNPANLMMVRLAQLIEKRSNNRLKFEIYPNGQLAKEQDSINGLMTGVVDMTMQTNGFLEPLFPHMMAIDLPFLFKDRAQAERTLDGPIGQELFADMPARGIQGLIWGTSGWHDVLNSGKPIVEPSDMKGMRLRIPSGVVYTQMMRALGALPVNIDFTETYMAIAQRTVDGYATPISSPLEVKMYDVAKFFSLTNHMYSPIALIMSKSKFDNIGSELQQVVLRSAKEVQGYWRSSRVTIDDQALTSLKEKGVKVNATNFAAFRKATEPMYADFRTRAGADFFDRVIKAVG